MAIGGYVHMHVDLITTTKGNPKVIHGTDNGKNTACGINLTKPEKKLIKNELFLLVIKAALFFVMGICLGLCRFF